MGKSILFSPVGGTDPISPENYKDGSMLHVCRVYKPDIVVLYMSAEILEKHRKDNRYIYCLERLSEHIGHKMQYKIIERPELVEVQEFDYFYNDFRNIIIDIYRSMDASDTLLLNVSSGTPAMKSALLVINTLGEFPFKAIQSSTPVKKMNRTESKDDFNYQELWELDADNENQEARCREIECPALSVLKSEEIIKRHIEVYDYRAAYDAADSMPKVYSKDYKELLELAAKRILLDFKEVDKLSKSTSYDCVPIKDSFGRKYFEYALLIDIKIKRGEFTDFIRSITPLIVDLFELVLKSQFKININNYCRLTKNNERIWDEQKMKGSDINSILCSYYGAFRYGPIYSDALAVLICRYSSDLKLNRLIEDLRYVEKNVRNLAAHEIVAITDDKIEGLSGFKSKKIMSMIKELFTYTGINVKAEYWNTYDNMNKFICSAIDIRCA